MTKASPYVVAVSVAAICFFLWSALQDVGPSDDKTTPLRNSVVSKYHVDQSIASSPLSYQDDDLEDGDDNIEDSEDDDDDTYDDDIADDDNLEDDGINEEKTNDGISQVISSQNDDKAPLFILQVGPSKTGTSTLQYYAAHSLDLLQKDNIYYIGHYKKLDGFNTHKLAGVCYHCDGGPMEAECNDRWADFERTVNNHYKKKHTVLMVEEMFSAFHDKKCEQRQLWDRLVPSLSKWRVRILFTYRRYHEWLPSQYIQLYNPDGCGRSQRKIKNRQTWPEDGGKTIPPFTQFFDEFGEHNYRSPIVIASKWIDHFDNVEVYNMHSDGHFLENWFCTHVPEASHLCNHLTEDYDSVTRNPSSSKKLHFDMLTMEAYKRGWINKRLTRKQVNTAVEAHALKLGFAKLMDFPTKCLSSEQTKTLLDRTLSHEADLLPELFESTGEAEVRQGFKEALDKGMYCSIDVDKVLQDKSWKDFFTNLDTGSEVAS